MPHTLTADDIFASLWRLAYCTCAVIEQEQPDLLLVLYKSGRLVELAVETVWAATHTQPLPPRVAVNLGTEKTWPFMNSDWPFHSLEWSDAKDTGHIVGWAGEQQQLLEPLQAKIRATVGDDHTPTRILILDDVIHDGGTALLALGLLWALYPTCETSLMAGLPPTWRQILGWHWAEMERPNAMETLIINKGVEGKFPDEIRRMPDHHWGALLAGMVDNVDDPLGWLPLTEDTMPWNDVFTMAMGAVALLELAPAIAGQLQTYLKAEVAQGAITEIIPLGREPRDGMPQRVALTWQEKLWGYAWQRGVVNVESLLPICGVTTGEITTYLETAVQDEELTRQDTAMGVRYSILPQLGAVLVGTLLTAPNPAFVALQWPEAIPRRAAVSVEFAYANPNAAGAPILSVVNGTYPATKLPVVAMHPVTFDDELLTALKEQAWLESQQVVDPAQSHRRWTTAKPGYLNDVAGLEDLFYYHHEPTLPLAVDQLVPVGSRAEQLAQQAIASLTAETYQAGTDGIAYLMQVTALGIETPLTSHYTQAILRLAGGVKTLADARLQLAQGRGIVSHQ